MQQDNYLADLVLTMLDLLNMLGKFCAGAAAVCVFAYTTIATMFGLDGMLGVSLGQWQLRGLVAFGIGLLVALATAWAGRLVAGSEETPHC